MAILDWLEGGGWLNFSPLFPLNLGYPLRFNQGFYNFQDFQKTLSLGNTWRGGGGECRYGKPRYKQSIQDI